MDGNLKNTVVQTSETKGQKFAQNLCRSYFKNKTKV